MPKAKPQSQFVTQITTRVFQSGQGFPLLPLAAPQTDADGGMAAVDADVHGLDVDSEEAWVVGFEADNFGEFFADGLGDA
jgi:hypothetical protein